MGQYINTKKDCFIVEEIISSRKNWKRVYTDVNQYFRNNIGLPGCFDKYVYFKFYKKEMMYRKMKINHFLINIIFWQPYIDVPRDLDESIIFKDKINKKSIANYLNNNVIIPNRSLIPMPLINELCARVIEKLKRVNEDYGLILAISTSLKDVIDMTKKNPELKKYLHYRVNEHAQPYEIEEELKREGDKFVEIIKTMDSPFKPLLDSGAGLKDKQFKQFMFNAGLQSDLNGVTFSTPVNTNYYIDGLLTPLHYYLDANSGRKAAVYNKLYVGDSGYFARSLTHLATDILLHTDNKYDCGTKHLSEVIIRNKDMLVMFNCMKYKKSLKDMFYGTIDCTKDTHLIGETIYVRTPLTCNSALDGGICYHCYGDMSYINNDINIGIYGANELTSGLTQKILSSKHLQDTDSIKINLTDDGVFFEIESNIIVLTDLEPDNIMNNYIIAIPEDNISYLDTIDDLDYNEYIDKLYIKDKSGNIVKEIAETEGNELFLSKYLRHKLRQKTVYNEELDTSYIEFQVKLKELDCSEPLFHVAIMSNELTKPLRDLNSLLGNKKHLGCETYSELVQKLADLMVESDIHLNITHALTAITNIMRDKKDILKRPDFTKDELEPYKMLSVKSALLSNQSPLISLSYESIAKQLKNPLTLKKKGKSIIDPLFETQYDPKYKKEE